MFSLCAVFVVTATSENYATHQVLEVPLLTEEEIVHILSETQNEDEDEDFGVVYEYPLVVRGGDKYIEDKCPLFEEYLTCGPTCQITCNTLGTACPAGPCVPGCFCKPGKVRSTHGICISQKICHSKLSEETPIGPVVDPKLIEGEVRAYIRPAGLWVVYGH